MEKTYQVWESPTAKGYLFSKGVTREFGENVRFKLHKDKSIRFAAILPLKCDPIACELEIIGTMYVDNELA